MSKQKREESREDYLERILMLSQEGNPVKAVDISRSMNFSKPSVSVALKNMKIDGLINVAENSGYITLTEKGLNIASSVYEKHQVLTKALVKLGVDEKTAMEDACKIEHDLSEKTFIAIKNSLND